MSSIVETPSSAMAAASAAAQRAGYHIPLNHFTEQRPRAAPHLFETERRLAIDQPVVTRLIPLDLGPGLGLLFAATTANMLACYLTIRAGESFELPPDALTGIHYVLSGSGRCRIDDEPIVWGAGDLMVLPAERPLRHAAVDGDARLLVVTDAPLWRYLGVSTLAATAERRAPVHYPAEGIAQQMASLEACSDPEAVGRAVIFTRSGPAGADHLTTPFFISNINTLLPGADQRSHRHNGAAITLCIEGDGCHSVIEDRTVHWQRGGVMVTPAGQLHSHHNRGRDTMVSLVIQDSGLYQHAGVPGFSFGPDAGTAAQRYGDSA